MKLVHAQWRIFTGVLTGKFGVFDQFFAVQNYKDPEIFVGEWLPTEDDTYGTIEISHMPRWVKCNSVVGHYAGKIMNDTSLEQVI